MISNDGYEFNNNNDNDSVYNNVHDLDHSKPQEGKCQQ